MSYLLDTCVLSELRKTVPHRVKEWFDSKDQDLFYISVVTIAELLDGIQRLPASKKRSELEDWFYGEVHTLFMNKIIPITDHVAKEWAYMSSTSSQKGIVVGVQDLYIAATAKSQGFSLITLNTKDFQKLGIPLINPWKD